MNFECCPQNITILKNPPKNNKNFIIFLLEPVKMNESLQKNTNVTAGMYNNEGKTTFYLKKYACTSLILMLLLESKKQKIYVEDIDVVGFLILEEISLFSCFKIEILMFKSKLYSLKLVFAQRSIEFICFHKLFPAALDEIASSLNLLFSKNINRTEMIFNECYWSDNTNFSKIKDIFCEKIFLMREVLNRLFLFFILTQKIKIYDYYSISGIAFESFFKNFNSKNVTLRFVESWDSILRDTFYGGRSEIFSNYDQNVFYYDFPGMYALSMLEKFPYGDISWIDIETVDVKNLKPGFYWVEWYSNDSHLPVLPTKNCYGKLIFKNGFGYGAYWYEELNLFLKQGGQILKVNQALVFSNFDYTFDRYVNYYQNLRNEGGSLKILSKFMVNTLFGKLGARHRESCYKVCKNIEEVEQIEKNKILSITKLNKYYIIEQKKKNKNKKGNIALASVITSKARIRLYELMNELIKNNGKLVCCDTDAIFVKIDPSDLIKISVDLQKGFYYEEVIFAKLKTYAFRKKNNSLIRIKGVLQNDASFSDFKERFLRGEFDNFNETNKSSFV